MTTSLDRRTVSSGDVDLAVFEGGNPDGPTIVLVHGWPDTHHLWTGVVDALADDFHVVAYDTRGQGQSTDPGSVAAFKLPELAKDFFAVADAVSPDAPVHVLAHDWGSVQLWEAVCEPGAERRIASFTSISGPNLEHLSAWVRRSVSRPDPRGLGALLAQGLASSYVGVFVSPLAPPLFRNLADRGRWMRFLRRTEGFEPPEEAVAGTLVDDMVSGLRYYRANVGLRPRPSSPRRTSVPVLLLVPTRDRAVRAASFDETARWVPQLERVDLPYGHWVPMAAPDVVAAETTRFIRSLPPRPVS
jgi:pimeloyl-ACP methyl ester carboxylesterase